MFRIFNILLTIFTLSTTAYGGMDYSKKYYFAVGIFTGAHSQLITYALITKSGNKIIGSQIIREQRFMYYLMGYWPTPANPNRSNLLAEHGVDSCFLTKNYANKINGYYTKPFYNLWKVRYKIHPIKHDYENGYSQGYYKPSGAQAKYIYQTYGVKDLKTEYIYGDSLYKLLRDIQNPGWISMYSALHDSI